MCTYVNLTRVNKIEAMYESRANEKNERGANLLSGANFHKLPLFYLRAYVRKNGATVD